MAWFENFIYLFKKLDSRTQVVLCLEHLDPEIPEWNFVSLLSDNFLLQKKEIKPIVHVHTYL